MDSILNNLKQEFKQGTILNKLIYLNVGVFLLFSILGVFSFMFQFNLSPVLDQLYLPAKNSKLLSQPWAFITYMFFHNGFLHLLFNMVWLHFAGKIFLQYLSPKQLLSNYILGGISGGLIFIIAYNYIPVLAIYTQNAQALGASAAVLAIMVAIATYTPNYSVRFPFIGIVKLKHIAIFSDMLDLLSIPKGNAGGHIAHIGGALFGYIYAKQLNKGIDISKNLYQLINIVSLKNIFKKQNKTKKNQTKIDTILEKISKSGYSSLNKQEKEILFNASKENK